MPTLTEAEVGTEVASDGVLDSIVMTTAPTEYSQDYFCLMDGDRVLYNVHIQTSGISTGGNLLSTGAVSFASLVLKSLPKGSVFEIGLAAPPTLTALTPNTVEAGSPDDFTLSCTGTDFTKDSIIVFGIHDEPTVFVSDTEVTTIVKPSLFVNPDVVPVKVRTATLVSAPLDFTFTAPPGAARAARETQPPRRR